MGTWVINYASYWVFLLFILFIRFIFTRYAHGLLHDQGSLFRKIVNSSIFCFLLYIILNIYAHRMMRNSKQKRPIKMEICLQDLEELTSWDLDSLKIKMIIIFELSIFSVLSGWMWISSKKQTKKYTIPQYRQNILNFDQDFTLYILISSLIIFDQLLNAMLEFFSNNLGKSNIFKIWWFSHLSFFFLSHIISPYLIILSAYQQYPEFRGLRGKPFPGREPYRQPNFLPREQVIVNLRARRADRNEVGGKSQPRKRRQDFHQIGKRRIPKLTTIEV